jgi:hypothetical protein
LLLQSLIIGIERLGDQNQLFHQMFHVPAANGETAGRKLNRVGQADNSDLIDLLLECALSWDQRAPGGGTKIVNPRTDSADFGILKWPSLAFCFGPPQTDERVL